VRSSGYRSSSFVETFVGGSAAAPGAVTCSADRRKRAPGDHLIRRDRPPIASGGVGNRRPKCPTTTRTRPWNHPAGGRMDGFDVAQGIVVLGAKTPTVPSNLTRRLALAARQRFRRTGRFTIHPACLPFGGSGRQSSPALLGLDKEALAPTSRP